MISFAASVPVPRRRRRAPAVAVVLALVLLASGATAGLLWAGQIPGATAIPVFDAPPGADDGILVTSVSILDIDEPAISRLDPTLRDAVGQAADAAADDGIVMEITSGWRSARYQQLMLDEAITTYGSAAEASRWVASPETSAHVSGRAVDVGPLDAQFWMMEHGARWGLCQIYANERWHYELATTPGGMCPDQRMDAAG
ncbi:M15 family metallopeptidase [Microbacterium sp. 1P10UB]|uniref:M15 family metallopeptidase n=1 Tax=unclassified Microbacterium TaxID=2609290 RepID=UPI00399FCFF6